MNPGTGITKGHMVLPPLIRFVSSICHTTRRITTNEQKIFLWSEFYVVFYMDFPISLLDLAHIGNAINNL